MLASQSGHLGVIILGMGRSGTSLTANLMSEAGVYVHSSISPDYRNPRGYWESQEVVDINRRILGLLGATTSWIPKLDSKWPEASILGRYRSRAKRVISELDVHPIWALKDPVFSITLPFWLPLFGRQIRFVVCIRNPLESVESYREFRTVAAEEDLSAWYEFTTHALRNTTGLPRLILHYHRYFDSQNHAQVDQLLEFLGLEPSTDSGRVVSRELYRNRVSLEALLSDQRVSSNIRDLYLHLLDHRGLGTIRRGCAIVTRVSTLRRLTRPLRTLFFRVLGFAWVVYQESGISTRLPRSVRQALGKMVGRWTP